ncbi:hypothetical protein ACFWZ7_08685 [Nocardiopsis alba]|uniref:hypothetical protein n=1 Tax=Nocardiopsis alba TaxID=53437 RepID=UPI00366AF06C
MTDLILNRPDLIEDIEIISDFASLKEMSFERLVPRASLNNVLPPQRLEELRFRSHGRLVDLGCLAPIPGMVERLTLIHCPSLRNIEGLTSQETSLTHFSYYGQIDHTLDLALLKELPLLENLQLSRKHLGTERTMKTLRSLSSVRRLEVNHGEELMRLPAWLRDMPSLETVRVHGEGSVDLTELAGAEGLTIEIAKSERRTVIGAEGVEPSSRVAYERLPLLFTREHRRRRKWS